MVSGVFCVNLELCAEFCRELEQTSPKPNLNSSHRSGSRLKRRLSTDVNGMGSGKKNRKLNNYQ